MRWKTLVQQGVLVALAALVAVALGVPHAHTVSQHDAEICTGHLADHGAASPDHPGPCGLCRVSQRTHEAIAPNTSAPAPAVAITARIAPREFTPRSTDRQRTRSPRAPPAFS